jgi:hypothetical protein
VQELTAPPDEPAAAITFRRRVVSRARDAGASRMARPRRGPGNPGPARVLAHPRREAEPCPSLAVPRYDPATALPCAATTRRGRDANTWAFPQAPIGRTPHTLALTHTHDHPEPELHWIWQPHQIRWKTDTRVPPVEGARGATPWARVVSEREREREIGVSCGPAC